MAAQNNTFGSDAALLNNTYDATTGALQVTLTGRGVTEPKENTFGSSTALLNTVYDSTLGALQVYIDSSSIGELDHGELNALSLLDDDHTQYPLSIGRSGGQTLVGGSGSEDNLILQSTSDATKGAVVFADPPWEDLNIGGPSLGGPASGRPTITEITATGGVATGIYTLGFDVGEKASGVLEIPHSYKSGTPLYFHLHWLGAVAPSGVDKVKWQLDYSIIPYDTPFPVPTPIVIETNYDAQYERVDSDFPAIACATCQMGDQFAFTLTRIAASADDYAGLALLLTAGFHYSSDTIGSRGVTTK